MDAYEATKIVLQRIQSLDPENASKIMGLLLIQDHGEKELIRLAFGPETLLQSVVYKARVELGLQASSPSTPSKVSPFGNPMPFSRQNSACSVSSRFSGVSPRGAQNPGLAAEIGGVGNTISTMNSAAPPFYGSGEVDLVDEFQLQDQLSFLDDGGGAANWGGSLHHRRSCSVNDINLGSDHDPSCGLGWKPCLYFARGYCKNGTGCRFLHGGGLGEASLVGEHGAPIVGSPSKFEIMASSSFPLSPGAGDKCVNFLLQQQQLQAESPRGLMMGGDMHKFSCGRLDRGDFGMSTRPGMVNPVSRQIYLTFPADSTFKEEDVSNYFSTFGPVQDVRIPYQQKRMFGFVTFVYPETVKIILAKGNPHFVCDSRVLVKPYKEKGKVPDKHRKQHPQLHMERADFIGCGSPTGLDSRDSHNLPFGPRMFHSQDMLWRRKMEEEADLRQAIDLQNRRLMGLQLLDVRRNNHHRTLSTGSVISSPISSPSLFSQNGAFPSDSNSPEKSENGFSPVFGSMFSDFEQEMQRTADVTEKLKTLSVGKDENGNIKESPRKEDNDLPESLEHNLPDSPFLSPKAAGECNTAFTAKPGEVDKLSSISATSSANNNNSMGSSLFPAATSIDMSPLKSCYFQLPRFVPRPGTVEM